MDRPTLPYSLQNPQPERVTTSTKLALIDALCARIRVLTHAQMRNTSTRKINGSAEPLPGAGV